MKSNPGKGSVFSFTARFEPSEESRIPASAGAQGMLTRGPGLRVLIVDDDPINVAVARRYLERQGQLAVSASSGAEAVGLVESADFDLVLLDLGLPDMDGFEACRLIRAQASAKSAASPWWPQ